MYLVYVDDSGDSGMNTKMTDYFILSAIIVHEENWSNLLDNYVAFRRTLKNNFGLKMREEIHCYDFIHSPGNLVRISKNRRILILKHCLTFLSTQADKLNIITVAIDKRNHLSKANFDPFEYAWKILTQRIENTISHNNFKCIKPTTNSTTSLIDKFIIISDDTQGEKLINLLRKIRKYNILPNRSIFRSGSTYNCPISLLVEDPVMRDSANSYFIQMTDVVAYFAKQLLSPCKAIKKKGRQHDYLIIHPCANKYVKGNKLLAEMIVK